MVGGSTIHYSKLLMFLPLFGNRGSVRIRFTNKGRDARTHYASSKSFAGNSIPAQNNKQTRRDKYMKKVLLSIALAFVAPFAWGQVSETTTTTTTTDANGTITEYTPGSTIVLKETSGPVHYRFGKTVTYVTRSGKVLDEDTVRTKVKVGVPVRVHYIGTGDSMMVDRVILDED
jgi:ribosomal protein L35AE/L33A